MGEQFLGKKCMSEKYIMDEKKYMGEKSEG